MDDDLSITAVYDKIKRLLALANDGRGNEHEMAVAADKAQRLMTQYNLTMATVEAAGGSSDGAKRVKDATVDKTPYKWRRDLMRAVAGLNFCHCSQKWERTGSSAKSFAGFELIGREANVASTRVMYDYLVQTIDRLAKDDAGPDPKQWFTRYAFSFRQGCSDRLVERLGAKRAADIAAARARADEEAAKARHPAYSGSGALVVVLGDYVSDENDLNNDMANGWAEGTTRVRRDQYERERQESLTRYEKRKRENNLKAQRLMVELNVSLDAARLVVSGYTLAEALRRLKPVVKKPETEAQRRKREQSDDAYWRRYNARQQREAVKLDQHGYFKGKRTGESISFSRQVDKQQHAKLGSGS